MSILFTVFAVSMAIGTFVENSYTTTTAREWIYDTWWFEGIMLLFVVNFIGNIKRYQLLRKKKWTTLLLHLSFILIIVGAGITRYLGEEGVMPIQEGKVSSTMLSQKTYLSVRLVGEHDGKDLQRSQNLELTLAPAIAKGKTVSTDFKGQDLDFEVVDFTGNAERVFEADPEGENYLKIVEATGGNRHDHYLKEGEVEQYHNILFSFNNPKDGAINITLKNGHYSIETPFAGNYMRMADQKKGSVAKDTVQALQLRSLYSLAGLKVVIPDPAIKGTYITVSQDKSRKDLEDLIKMKVSSQGESKMIELRGAKGKVNPFKEVDLAGLNVNLRYGSKEIELPFALRLTDFIAKKYPGTADRETPSYAGFRSKVDLIDEGKEVPKEIYMNNVLDHKGYRFFQSSFQPDESGTILSVNHDKWGTWVTYTGYMLLYLGLMLILFDPGSRFGDLKKQLDKVKKKKAQLSVVLVLFSLMSGFNLKAQDSLSATQGPQNKQAPQEAEHQHSNRASPLSWTFERTKKFIKANAVNAEHADKFARLIIQDRGGRMKPANTYSSELLRKISKQNEFVGLNSDQVLLSMMEIPAAWYNVPLVYVKSKNDSLHHVLDVEEGKKRLALRDFFDKQGTYKLTPFLESAYRAKVKNQFQKDYIDVDKKVSLLSNTLEGRGLKIFPVPNSENNKWISFTKARQNQVIQQDSMYQVTILPMYLQSLQKARNSGDFETANKALQILKGYQHNYGGDVMPSDNKVEAEILYNEHDVFRNLFWQYMLAGLVMFLFVILRIFYDNRVFKIAVNISKVAVIILFLLHTAGLIFRWYISGHAPWTDAYESMIYVGWATMFFGLAFGRKSNLTIASTAFVAAIIMMVAHWNWMDPAISNLVPVLDSYWLMIHVAVIVASYGPFTLGMILGLVALLLMILTTKKNKRKMSLNIQEITIITELALTVGLVMLTIGNFLGGMWANESWGRYWGWDPKETWALISIMVYAFVIHMRLVPGLRGRFAFNWAAIIAFGSILMTYFGVNFYLSGLHSYASGDQIISYKFIGIALGVWLLLGFLAYLKYKKFYFKPVKKKKK
jgi:cytochrome c-type biogenesis protein CcsB